MRDIIAERRNRRRLKRLAKRRAIYAWKRAGMTDKGELPTNGEKNAPSCLTTRPV